MLIYPSKAITNTYIDKYRLISQCLETWIFTPYGVYLKKDDKCVRVLVNEVVPKVLKINDMHYTSIEKPLFTPDFGLNVEAYPHPSVQKSFLVQRYKINTKVTLVVKCNVSNTKEKVTHFEIANELVKNKHYSIESLLNNVLVDIKYDCINS